MYAPKHNKKDNNKSYLWRQTAAAKSESQIKQTSQHAPLVQHISRMGNAPNPSAYASILNRAPVNQQSSNRQLLLQLQHQYGNSYVKNVLQLARSKDKKPSTSQTHSQNAPSSSQTTATTSHTATSSSQNVPSTSPANKPGQSQANVASNAPSTSQTTASSSQTVTSTSQASKPLWSAVVGKGVSSSPTPVTSKQKNINIPNAPFTSPANKPSQSQANVVSNAPSTSPANKPGQSQANIASNAPSTSQTTASSSQTVTSTSQATKPSWAAVVGKDVSSSPTPVTSKQQNINIPKAKDKAEEYAKDIVAKTPENGDIPTAACAVVNKKNGKVYTDTSGNPRPTGQRIHQDMQTKMPEKSCEVWPVNNCAEFKAVNKALFDGAKRADLEVHTVKTRTGKAFPRCGNCKQTTAGTTVTSE